AGVLGALLLAGCAVHEAGPAVGTLPAGLDPSLATLIERTRDAAPDPHKISAAFARLLETRNLGDEDLLSWSGLETDLADVALWAELLGDANARSVAVV